MNWLADTFPPLYSCSVCGVAVSVTSNGVGCEPTITRACEHADAIVHANRKTTLYGKGEVNMLTRQSRKIRLTVRQLLSMLTGRSI